MTFYLAHDLFFVYTTGRLGVIVTMAGKTEYKNVWQRENKDRINLTVPKGQKEVIKAHADKRKESVNGFIGRAITETIERDDAQEIAGAGQVDG